MLEIHIYGYNAGSKYLTLGLGAYFSGISLWLKNTFLTFPKNEPF